MHFVQLADADSRLSALVSRVVAGEEIVRLRGQTPVAKRVPIAQPSVHRRFGAMHGQAHPDAASFEPMPEHELAAWGA